MKLKAATPSPIKSWLRLARISALPSAISNILLGFLLAKGTWAPSSELWLLIAASACLYIAGMILNDVFDADIDAIERPARPIPSGQIRKSTAAAAGAVLILVGIASAGGAWLISSIDSPKPLLIAVALSICVVLYDGVLKKTIAAPLVMGVCRSLNILLGASTVLAGRDPEGIFYGFPLIVWWAAISVGIFVCGFTLLARHEAAESQSKPRLALATLIIFMGLSGLALIPFCPNQLLQLTPQLETFYPLIIGFIGLHILRRAIFATITGSPKLIQATVISCLRSIIILDASLCFLIAPDHPLYAVSVIGLLIPAIVLGRFISST